MNDHAPQGGARNDRAHASSDSHPESLRRPQDDGQYDSAADWPPSADRYRYTITRSFGRREGSR